MCDANPKSFEYVKKILDFALGEFDFGGVHLESCDLGCCGCPSCAGKDGIVGYNVRINQQDGGLHPEQVAGQDRSMSSPSTGRPPASISTAPRKPR